MKKIFIPLFLLLNGLVVSTFAQNTFTAKCPTGQTLEYTITGDGEVSLTKAEDEISGNCTIPEKVTHKGKTYTVTSIGEYAFFESFVKSVIIPNTVTSIGNDAFFKSDLLAINIPKSVTSIGEGAFNYCRLARSITVEKDNPVYDSRENCNALIETATNTLLQ